MRSGTPLPCCTGCAVSSAARTTPACSLRGNWPRPVKHPWAWSSACPKRRNCPACRQLRFLLDGLPPLETRLRELGIPLFLRIGPPADELGKLLRETGAGTLTTDFDPLRPAQNHVQRLCSLTDAAIWEVDSRNIVPCWLASDKKEYMARTHPTQNPPPTAGIPVGAAPAAARPQALARTSAARGLGQSLNACGHGPYPAPPVNWILPADRNTLPGEDEAQRRLGDFCTHRLHGYALNRNDPVKDASSRLSPWLHFGFLSLPARGPGRHRPSR